MKAIIYHQYGHPGVMELQEIKEPVPADDQVLVRVHAASVNASDYEFLTGSPKYTRMWGLFKPKVHILGSDIAGKVVAVGKNVSRFGPGDAVFGDIFEQWGGFAEYVCAPASALIQKPDSLSFEQAAALPQAACLALQSMHHAGPVQSGQSVLINGAGGGAGSFAVQLAKHYGAEVTGVDHTEKIEFMRSLGADHVIDYTRTDFTRNNRSYDRIIDFVACHSIFAYQRALDPDGVYLMIGGSIPHVLQTLLLGSLLSLIGTRKMAILGAKPNHDLEMVVQTIADGHLKPVIDKQFPLDEVPQALDYLGKGLAKGKIVITLDNKQ